MITAITEIVHAIITLFIQMAPYLLFGFIVSGLLYVLIPRSLIIKHLKPNKTRSIFKAAIMGVPLPLCSCGVIPVAAHLRKQGANKSATVSFLASTPSTGADSILATYSLMGPIYAIFRPIDALFSGVLAGVLVKWLNADTDHDIEATPAKQAKPFTFAPKASLLSQQPSSSLNLTGKLAMGSGSSCCSSEVTAQPIASSCCSSEVTAQPVTSSCCSSEAIAEPVTSSCCSSEAIAEPVTSSCCSSEAIAEPVTSSCCSSEAPSAPTSGCSAGKEEVATDLPFSDKLKAALNYGLFELVDDTKKWILIGIVIGGVLSWGIPDELASYWIAYPALSYLSMLLIGLPMYVCATASIPIATAMLMNGLSPGAALVFLAVGPATNTATMAFLSASMGKKNMFIYVFSISFSAIFLGIIIDLFFGQQLKDYFQATTHMVHIGAFDYLLSAILAGLILFQYAKKLKR